MTEHLTDNENKQAATRYHFIILLIIFSTDQVVSRLKDKERKIEDVKS